MTTPAFDCFFMPLLYTPRFVSTSYLFYQRCCFGIHRILSSFFSLCSRPSSDLIQVFACFEMWGKLSERKCTAAPVVVYAVYKSLGDVWNKVRTRPDFLFHHFVGPFCHFCRRGLVIFCHFVGPLCPFVICWSILSVCWSILSFCHIVGVIFWSFLSSFFLSFLVCPFHSPFAGSPSALCRFRFRRFASRRAQVKPRPRSVPVRPPPRFS